MSLIACRNLLFWALVLVVLTFDSVALAANKEHKVKPGDSIAKIADYYGVGQGDLLDLNGLHRKEGVRPGQVLEIPSELRGGASKGHVIRKGDTIASIAKKHHVSRRALMAANKLKKKSRLKLGRTLVIPDPKDDPTGRKTLKKASKLVKSGEKVSGGVRHTVQPGQSLWIIARAYNTTGAKIAKANQFGPKTPLKAGQTILIPGAKAVVPVRVKGYRTQSVKFVSVWNNKSAKIRLISKSGRINQKGRKALSRLAGPKGKRGRKRVKLLHPRLIHMLQRVAERFPGHTIEIVSGYRPHKKGRKMSKHSQARAVDFRVGGISKKELYDYIKELPKVGAGYYPNSVFVHLDVRGKKFLWTDYSGPGEPAQMTEPSPSSNTEAEADVQPIEQEILKTE